MFESCKLHAQEQLELMNSVQRNLHETDKKSFNLVMKSPCSYVQNALGKCVLLLATELYVIHIFMMKKQTYVCCNLNLL